MIGKQAAFPSGILVEFRYFLQNYDAVWFSDRNSKRNSKLHWKETGGILHQSSFVFALV